MARLKLSLACWDYDRTRALADGSVRAEGIDLLCLNLPVEETFFRMLRKREFDCAEMSLSSYVLTLQQKNPPFVAIPVFPSRFFRHSCIFVNSRSGITRPGQLAGKRIGVPEYQMTAAVWIRGILSDEFGVPAHAARYLTGGLEEPGREEKLKLSLPAKFRVVDVDASITQESAHTVGGPHVVDVDQFAGRFRRQVDARHRLADDPIDVRRFDRDVF